MDVKKGGQHTWGERKRYTHLNLDPASAFCLIALSRSLDAGPYDGTKRRTMQEMTKQTRGRTLEGAPE